MRADVSAALATGRTAGWEHMARTARSPEQAVRGFEEILLQMVVRAMRRTVDQGGLFGSQPAHGVYEHFVEQALSSALVRQDIGMERLLLPVLRGRGEQRETAERSEGPLWAPRMGAAQGGTGTEGFATGGGQGPLAAMAPPTDDPWLDRPDAGRVLLQLMGAGTEVVGGGNR